MAIPNFKKAVQEIQAKKSPYYKAYQASQTTKQQTPTPHSESVSATPQNIQQATDESMSLGQYLNIKAKETISPSDESMILRTKAKEAPLVFTQQGKIDWAKQRITPEGIRRSIGPTEFKTKYGYVPGGPSYDTAISDTRSKIVEAEAMRREYESGIAMVRSSDPSSQWWIDVNKNKLQEEDEIFSRDVALAKLDVGYRELKYSIIPELKASQAVFEEYKAEGYKLEKTDDGYGVSLPSAEETFKSLYPGAFGESRFVAKQAMSLGIPALFNVGRWDEYREEEFGRMLEMSPSKNEDLLGYTGRFWTSPEAIESTWIPLATFGAGYVIKGLSVGGQVVGKGLVASKLSGFGATMGGRLTSVGLKTGLATVGAFGITTAGITLGSIAARSPSQLGTVGGHLLSTGILAAGGFYTGQSAFAKNIPKPLVINGQKQVDVTLKMRDVSTPSKMGKGNIGMVKGEIEAFMYGKQPGTGIRYSYKLSGVGRSGVSIGPDVSVSKAGGRISTPKGKTLNVFETYGKSTSPIRFGDTDFYFNVDKSVSGLYGKQPDVFTTRGYNVFKEMGSKTLSMDMLSAKYGKLMFKDQPMVDVLLSEKGFKMAEFDTSMRFSFGDIKSSGIFGSYKELGASWHFKGFKTGGIEPVVKGSAFKQTDMSGLNAAFGRQATSQVLADVQVNIPSFSSGVHTGPLITRSLLSSGFGGVAVVSVSKVLSLPSMKGLSSLSDASQIYVQRLDQVNIPSVDQFTIQRVSQVSIPNVNQLSIQRLGQVQLPTVKQVSIQKLGLSQIQRHAQIQKLDTMQIQKTAFSPYVIPSLKTGIIPIPPVLPFNWPGWVPRSRSYGGGYGFLGYRFRIHKTPTIESLIPKSVKKMLKKWR